MARQKPDGGSGRSYLSDVDKVAAHPTRRALLKALEKGPRTTVELEQETGENRYHLYHHLAVLEEAQLVASAVSEKSKQFSLLKPSRPHFAYLDLRRDDPDELKKLSKLLDVVGSIEEAVPHLDKVTRARVVLYYPWSPDETV